MTKKSSLLATVFAVFVFAVPAMANAAVPTLQNAAGEPLPVGTIIRLTGSNVAFTSNVLGEIKCARMTLEGTISVNDMTNGFTISNNGQPSPPTTDCTNGTQTINVTDVTITDLKSTVGGEVLFSFIEEVDVGASIKCKFTGTNVKGAYANGGSALTFSGATGITGSPVACGTGKLDAEFTLEQASGATVKAVF